MGVCVLHTHTLAQNLMGLDQYDPKNKLLISHVWVKHQAWDSAKLCTPRSTIHWVCRPRDIHSFCQPHQSLAAALMMPSLSSPICLCPWPQPPLMPFMYATEPSTPPCSSLREKHRERNTEREKERERNTEREREREREREGDKDFLTPLVVAKQSLFCSYMFLVSIFEDKLHIKCDETRFLPNTSRSHLSWLLFFGITLSLFFQPWETGILG